MSIKDIQDRLDAAGSGDANEGDNTVDDGDVEGLSTDDDAYEGDETEDNLADDDSSSAGSNTEDSDDDKSTSRESTMSKIAKILTNPFKKKDTEDHTDDDGDDETDLKDEESNEGAAGKDHDDGANQEGKQKFIDPRFVASARKYGWDDTQILAYADDHKTIDMVQLGLHMDEASGTDESQGGDDGNDVDLISEEVLAKLAEEEDNLPIINDVVKPLLAQVQMLTKSLEGIQSNQQGMDGEKDRQEQVRDYDYANSVFDDNVKDFKVLGTTDQLKRLPDNSMDARDPAVKARTEVFGKAMMFKNSDPNISMKSAMDDAMIWFRGKYGADNAEKKLLKKIKGNSNRVSPKSRSQHKTRKFDNDRDRKASVVQDVLDRPKRK